jgi:hypothetical protein
MSQPAIAGFEDRGGLQPRKVGPLEDPKVGLGISLKLREGTSPAIPGLEPNEA